MLLYPSLSFSPSPSCAEARTYLALSFTYAQSSTTVSEHFRIQKVPPPIFIIVHRLSLAKPTDLSSSCYLSSSMIHLAQVSTIPPLSGEVFSSLQLLPAVTASLTRSLCFTESLSPFTAHLKLTYPLFICLNVTCLHYMQQLHALFPHNMNFCQCVFSAN